MADARERTGPLRSGHRLQTVVPMSHVRALRGISSGIEYDADVPMNFDPADGRPVEMVLDIARRRRLPGRVPQLLDRWLLKRGERVVAVNTGSAKKNIRRRCGICCRSRR